MMIFLIYLFHLIVGQEIKKKMEQNDTVVITKNITRWRANKEFKFARYFDPLFGHFVKYMYIVDD